jgi:hypothetical protein
MLEHLRNRDGAAAAQEMAAYLRMAQVNYFDRYDRGSRSK